jgi:TPR repeat protein
MFRFFFVVLLSLSIIGCHATYSPAATSELLQGKRDFDGGYYKRAMRGLLPLACNGNPDAQYAVGYMYYYGYGVAQDTNVGTFWIESSAQKNYKPAISALQMIATNTQDRPRHRYGHSP